MDRSSWIVAVGALAIGVPAASCTKSKAPLADSTTSAAAAHATPSAAAADVRFMQGMMSHHAQALVMTAMARTHGASPHVQLLSRKIDVSQRDEMTMMRHWLADRKQSVPDPNAPMAMPMPGMLSAEQLEQLDAARDTAFDRLFLTFMIQHHDGAIKMVADLFATPGGGQAPEVFRYATDVDNDQRAEIARMRQMFNASS